MPGSSPGMTSVKKSSTRVTQTMELTRTVRSYRSFVPFLLCMGLFSIFLVRACGSPPKRCSAALSPLHRASRLGLPRGHALLELLRHDRPIGPGQQPLQQVHELRIAADQDPRLVLLYAMNDALRRHSRRVDRHRFEALDRLGAAGVVVDAGAGAGIAHDVGGDAAG